MLSSNNDKISTIPLIPNIPMIPKLPLFTKTTNNPQSKDLSKYMLI